MKIINECNKYYLNQTELVTYKAQKNFKISTYLDYIYNYPPKIRILWNSIDDLNEDQFAYSKYRTQENLYWKKQNIEDWLSDITSPYETKFLDYSRDQYLDGFLDGINSTNFFLKNTKQIQDALNHIPIFVLLNGHGEIVLSKPSNILSSRNPATYINEKLYDSSGTFDPIVEKKSALGLFFISQVDAENYLREVGKADPEGAQTTGFSIHCISLGSAYKITREYHPGIDFRFVPKFNEVKNLLANMVEKSFVKEYILFEEEQQMCRARHRNINLGPHLEKSFPGYSFLARNEYFKGVPIYILQLPLVSSNNFSSTDFNNPTEDYIFFEKDAAIKFRKENDRPSRKSKVPKSKIIVYNLEDYLEDWEDNILGNLFMETRTPTIFDFHVNHFISQPISVNKIEQNSLKDLSQTLNLKCKFLKRAVGVLFSL